MPATSIQPYLFFEGRCQEALDFYADALGAVSTFKMLYSQSPVPAMCGDGTPIPGDKVMHANLQIGDSQLMVSDGMNSGKPTFSGISLTLSATDDADAKKKFDALVDGGSVLQPLQKTFFSTSFGMLHDRFGVMWTVIVPQPMPQ